MGGRRLLKGGAPRLLGRHDGLEGWAYRRAFDALAEAFDLPTPLLRFEAGRVAALRVQLEAATQALTAAQRARRIGRGRRPNAQAIERLARRQGLADGSYSQGLEKLRELAGRNGRQDFPALVAQAHREKANAGR